MSLGGNQKWGPNRVQVGHNGGWDSGGRPGGEVGLASWWGVWAPEPTESHLVS